MFENRYVMNAKLYRRWMVPVFYRTKFFWIMLAVFLTGTVSTVVFYSTGASDKWKTLGLLMMFIGLYRGMCFDWITADKQFKIMSARSGKKQWDCRIVIGRTIRMFMDEKLNNEVFFGSIKTFTEGKSYFDLGAEQDRVRLDKAGFVKGTAEDFKAWMLSEHPEIEYKRAENQFDR